MYNIPNHLLFCKYNQYLLLENLRKKIIKEYYIKISNNKKLNNYVKKHTIQRQIFEWSSYTSSSSSDSSESFIKIDNQDSEWIDMKKLL